MRRWIGPAGQGNRHLLHDLAALGAQVLQQWVQTKYGVRVPIMVVQHTFSRRLTFHPHLHILVSAGGLQESQGLWMARLSFDEDALMHMWRYAVIPFLRVAVKMIKLTSDIGVRDLKVVLETQYDAGGTSKSLD